MGDSKHSEKRYSYPGVIPIRGRPSPSSPQLSTSGRSYVSPPQQIRNTPQGQNSSANDALEAAFASYDEQPDIFPASVYREPSRSLSRSGQTSTRSSISSVSTSRSATGRSSLDSSRLSPPNTFDSRERSYSPLAAGFARLNQKDINNGTSPVRDGRGRSGGSKSSLELESRMFAGPA